MSILPAALNAATQSAATQSLESAAPGEFAGLLFFSALAIGLAWHFRVFHRESVVGPPRVPDGGSLGSLFIVFCIGLCLWLFAQGAYAAYRQTQLASAPGVDIHAMKLEDLLTPSDFAFLSTFPPVLGFLTLVIADRFANRDQLPMLGLGWRGPAGRGVRRGLLQGVIGFFIVMPIVMWTLYCSELVFQRLNFQHPREHVLLKNLGQAESGTATVMILLGATVMAPFFEELLFRGHLQTLVREFLARAFAGRAPAPSAAAAAFEGPAAMQPPLLPPLPPVSSLNDEPVIDFRPHPKRATPAAWHGWTAIVITSAIFAMSHEPWSWPAIFVLAIGLGYLYERTGNLWATITVHLLFNTFNTLQFVWLMSGR